MREFGKFLIVLGILVFFGWLTVKLVKGIVSFAKFLLSLGRINTRLYFPKVDSSFYLPKVGKSFYYVDRRRRF